MASPDAFRIVRLIVPAGTAGGITIWQRSPPGRVVETIGCSGPMSWRVKAAAAVARLAR